MFTSYSNTSKKNYDEHTLILMPFTELAASFHTKTGKHKLHITDSSLMSKTQSADAQFNYFCAYSGLQNTLKIH